MSLYDYRVSQEISAKDYPVDALLMAAMRKADSNNMHWLQAGWPHLWDELRQRHGAPGGYILPEDANVKAREDAEWEAQNG